MKFILLRFSALAVIVASPAFAAADLTAARTALEQWVELRKTISAEQSAWRAGRESLQDMIDLMKSQAAHLDAQIKAAGEAAAASETQYTQLSGQNDLLTKNAAVVTDVIGRLEARTAGLAEFFPPDLRARVAPQLHRMPPPGTPTRISASERLQLVVGILNEAEKFNATITVASELQKLPGGDTVQVDTLYLGLAVAYFVDGTNTHAGILRPAKGGWIATPDPGLAGAIRKTIAVHRNESPAVFVPLPVEIK